MWFLFCELIFFFLFSSWGRETGESLLNRWGKLNHCFFLFFYFACLMRLIFALLRIKILWCPLFLLAKQKMSRRCFCFFFLALNLIRLNVCAIRQLIPNSDMTANNATNAVCFLCVAQRAPLSTFSRCSRRLSPGCFLFWLRGCLQVSPSNPAEELALFPLR